MPAAQVEPSVGRALARPLRYAALLLVIGLLAGCGTNTTTTVVKERTVTTRSSPPPTTTTTAAPEPEYVSYQGSGYTAQIPAAWETEADQVDQGSYIESLFRDPVNPNTSITIDVTPGITDSPESSATLVSGDTSQTPGYQELLFEPTTVGTREAFKWSFEVSGDRRVDYFFNDCGNGMALLGSASPSDFASQEPVFQAVVDSIEGGCASASSAAPPAPPPPEPPPVESASFCDTHLCIDNFDEGNGYPVQCNDGMWSQSGGIQGACSYHGGVRG